MILPKLLHRYPAACIRIFPDSYGDVSGPSTLGSGGPVFSASDKITVHAKTATGFIAAPLTWGMGQPGDRASSRGRKQHVGLYLLCLLQGWTLPLPDAGWPVRHAVYQQPLKKLFAWPVPVLGIGPIVLGISRGPRRVALQPGAL